MNDNSIAVTVLMIRPTYFGANAETAASNRFQRLTAHGMDVREAAKAEFDTVVQVLREAGIAVAVFEDTPEPQKPDAVFPNNWVSFHEDGTVCLYPMQAQNRRLERRRDILQTLQDERGYHITTIEDWSDKEREDRYLEGTGSLVLDRANRLAYACLSSRTDARLARAWCRHFNYQPVLFHATDSNGAAIYHTNVMMCIGDRFAVVCLDCIPDHAERETVTSQLQESGHRIVPISMQQMAQFAGNMLLLRNDKGEPILVMSSRAEQSLADQQHSELRQFARIVSSPLDTIEDCAGGSMRCMIAELFLLRT
ncbi:MAG: citrulline utilization hydrolase CtlX [Gammaproteobacteria bacterium]